MQYQKPKGSTLLKVVGILMIIGGAISIIGGIGVFALGGLSAVADAGGLATLLFVVGAVVLIGGIIQLIAGIFGVKFCNLPEKAGACIVMGIIVIVLAILNIIFNAVLANAGGGNGATALTYITGLVLPILYLIGAFQNKNSNVAPMQGQGYQQPQQGYQQAPQQDFQQAPQQNFQQAPMQAPEDPVVADQSTEGSEEN